MTDLDVRLQYQTTDLLEIRVETHARYTENPIDLDAECRWALGLGAGDSLLDVGCGPGVFLRYLRAQGHRGRLAGLDQSAGMIASASGAASGSDVEWFVGDAASLPFPDGAFTAVSARHMLYHVADIPAALREFGRVTAADGTVLVTTNDVDNLPRIGALEGDALSRFGLERPPAPGVAFSTANAPAYLAEAFAEVSETVLRNTLVFEDPAPIVRYVMTMTGIQRVAGNPELLAEIEEWVAQEAEKRLTALGGVWRDPKAVAIYLGRPKS